MEVVQQAIYYSENNYFALVCPFKTNLTQMIDDFIIDTKNPAI